MPGIAGENKLIMIALVRKNLGHVLVGYDPIMHVIAHDIRIEKILVADFHPNADGFGGTVRNEMFVKFPSAMWDFGVVGPLLIHISPRISQDAMIKLGMIPGH